MNKKKSFSNLLLLVTALWMLLLAGCGVLRQTDADDATTISAIEPINSDSAETVAISDVTEQQGVLQDELATLREQVITLSEQLTEQSIALDSAETELANALAQIETGAPPPLDPIVVETEEIPVVQTSNPAVSVDVQDALTGLYDIANPSTVFILISNQQGIGGSGSGFVYDSSGHIVTNNHVVEGATDITVVFADGTRSEAELVGTDVDSDLAVIRAETLAEDALPLPLGRMENVDVGQIAVAIGNPFGEQGSMSMGIISGLGRSLMSQRQLGTSGSSYQLPQVIQTDAPINPGNSGGPLLNLNGEVIGVNAAIRTTTGENSGVGFSIPVNAVRNIVPELIENGEYTYPYLGLSFLPEERKQRILEDADIDTTFGAYVGGVLENGPADQGGVQGSDVTGFGGDLIVALNGEQIKDFDDLNAYLVFNTKPGDVLEASVLRDSEMVTLEITLGERP